MSPPAGNPYEPPIPVRDLPVERVAGRSTPVTEVTFRYAPDDLRRIAMSGVRPMLLVSILLLALVATIGPIVYAQVRREGLNPRVVGVTLGSLAVGLTLVGITCLLSFRRPGRCHSEVPFDTTLSLSPQGLRIREAGIAELLRSWPGIARVSHDRDFIQIDFLVFDSATGRFVARPGTMVPIRAFATEEEAASFLAAARAYHAASGPPISSN